MILYIAQVNYNYTNKPLTKEFLISLIEPFGKITSIILPTIEFTKNSKSFAYVELKNEQDAIAAIKASNMHYNTTTETRLIVKRASEHTLPTNNKADKENYTTIFI